MSLCGILIFTNGNDMLKSCFFNLFCHLLFHSEKSCNCLPIILGVGISFGRLFLLMDIGMMAMSPNRNRLYRSGGMNYMICSLFAGLTLLMLNSSLCSDDGGCRISKGAKIMISSTVMWFASGVSVMMLNPPWIKREITRDEDPGLGPSVTDPLMAHSLPYLP